MDGVNVPFLPTGLWLMTTALTLVVLLLAFAFYVYQRKRQAALIGDSKEVAELAARKQILQADVEAVREWLEKQKVELDRMKAEREDQERLRAELAALEQQIAARDQENQALRNEVGELENQRHLLNMTLDTLRRDVGDVESMRGEAETLKKELADLERKCQESQGILRSAAEVQARLEALNAERLSLERAVEERKMAAEQAGRAADQARQKVVQAKSEAEEEEQKLRDIRHEWAQLEVLVNSLRTEQGALENHIRLMEKKVPQLEEKVQAAREQVKEHSAAAEQARNKAAEAERLLANARRTRDETEERINELVARKAALEQDVKRLEERFGPTPDVDSLAAYADLLEVVPECLSRAEFPEGELPEVDELTALQRLRDRLSRDKLKFSARAIDAFHTSLKCHDITPLTVLAGVSGTGKTLLPMYYAKMMGMHSLVMAVQPRWDSPQDMFGFYNYLEKQYKATELSRALVRMDPYNYKDDRFDMLDCAWARDRILLVLLDEMNLARTEYYFSEFLSKLELRRQVKHAEDRTDRERAEIELDAGPSKDLRFRLWVGHNIVFVGTMNEDETTQTLSDKVLDRANVIRFGKPDERTRPSPTGDSQEQWMKKYLSYNQWQSWLREFDDGVAWYDEVLGWIRRLNAALDKVGRPFGFRVQQAIGLYVANYPRVDEDGRHRLAFADQVELKIIPKLRGIDVGDNSANECLSDVESVIAELGDGEMGDAFDNARTESENLAMFQWRGVTRRVQ